MAQVVEQVVVTAVAVAELGKTECPWWLARPVVDPETVAEQVGQLARFFDRFKFDDKDPLAAELPALDLAAKRIHFGPAPCRGQVAVRKED